MRWALPETKDSLILIRFNYQKAVSYFFLCTFVRGKEFCYNLISFYDDAIYIRIQLYTVKYINIYALGDVYKNRNGRSAAHETLDHLSPCSPSSQETTLVA